MCESDHVCCHAPSQGSKPESGRELTMSPRCHSSVWLLTFHVSAPLPSHSSLPPSSLCSGRASHLEQQAAGGDDIICTAAHCSTGSEQRHVSLPLTIPSLTPSISLCLRTPPPNINQSHPSDSPPETSNRSWTGSQLLTSPISTCW